MMIIIAIVITYCAEVWEWSGFYFLNSRNFVKQDQTYGKQKNAIAMNPLIPKHIGVKNEILLCENRG